MLVEINLSKTCQVEPAKSFNRLLTEAHPTLYVAACFQASVYRVQSEKCSLGGSEGSHKHAKSREGPRQGSVGLRPVNTEL